MEVAAKVRKAKKNALNNNDLLWNGRIRILFVSDVKHLYDSAGESSTELVSLERVAVNVRVGFIFPTDNKDRLDGS